jgi:replication-associated recombination protein RarA
MSAMWKNHESGGNKLTKLMVKVWSALPMKHTELNPMFEAQEMLLTRCELKSFSKATRDNIRASPLTKCELKTFCITTYGDIKTLKTILYVSQGTNRPNPKKMGKNHVEKNNQASEVKPLPLLQGCVRAQSCDCETQQGGVLMVESSDI